MTVQGGQKGEDEIIRLDKKEIFDNLREHLSSHVGARSQNAMCGRKVEFEKKGFECFRSLGIKGNLETG